MSRGGKRNGRAGAAYAQRTDLAGSAQAIQAAPGQAYGAAQAQRDSQAVVPLAGTAVPPPSARPAGQPQGATGGVAGPVPGMGFADPSSRPGEPVTAGMSMGAGGGPELLGPAPDSESDVATRLRAMYLAMPTEEVRQMIEDLESD